jgi:hypothetical protein
VSDRSFSESLFFVADQQNVVTSSSSSLLLPSLTPAAILLARLYDSDLQPLVGAVEVEPGNATAPPRSAMDTFFATYFESNPEFFKQAFTFVFCFIGLQASYLTWGYMQGELPATTSLLRSVLLTPACPDDRIDHDHAIQAHASCSQREVSQCGLLCIFQSVPGGDCCSDRRSHEAWCILFQQHGTLVRLYALRTLQHHVQLESIRFA